MSDGTIPTLRMPLERCAIVADEQNAPLLRRCIEDARQYLSEISGTAVRVTSRIEPGEGSVIAVGEGPARALLGKPFGIRPGHSPEGFRLRTGMRDGRSFACVVGTTPAGTARGLARLLLLAETDRGRAALPSPLDIETVPRFALRGMHLNGWAANYPYAFRGWREEDWLRYIDILWYEGVNLLLLWPSMDIIPVPMSREDEAYLQEVRRVVEYARHGRGMEVWIMHSANRIALSDCGVQDPRLRPYWLADVQVDLDPGQPDHLEAILGAREPLYRIVNNADGFVIIDSDPGGWDGSPVRVLVELLQRTREMLNRMSERGPTVKLINWLWQGWGFTSWDPANRQGVIADTVAQMREKLPEPWMLIAGTGSYLPYLRTLGVLDRTVYLPYGAIEVEPSLPFTNVDVDAIRGALDSLAEFPQVAGVMGNVQCPLLQMPLVHHMMQSLWDFSARARPEAEMLVELARLLHPEQRLLVAEAFGALNATRPESVDRVLHRIRELATSGGTRAGAIGRLLFPSPNQVLQDLAGQLELRRAEAVFAGALESGADAASLALPVADYFRACLRWEAKHGFFKILLRGRLNSLFPRPPIPRDTIRTWPPFIPYALGLRSALDQAGDPLGTRFFEPVRQALAAEFGEELAVQGCIEPMRVMMQRWIDFS